MPPSRYLAAILRIGVCATVLLSPLPFGSVQPWAVRAIETCAAILGVGALWTLFREPDRLTRRSRLVVALALVIVGVGLVQLIPLPTSVVHFVAGPTAEARERVLDVVPEVGSSTAPISLAPTRTLDASSRFIAYFLLGLTAVVVFRTPGQLRVLASVIAISAAFQAFYGSFEFLSGRQHIFGYAKVAYVAEATGTFINRNHFAGYLAMALPLALGLLIAPGGQSNRVRSWREWALRLADPAMQLRAFAAFAVFCIWVGILLSRSRAGLAAALVATLATVFYLSTHRRRTWWLAAALVAPLLFLLYLDASAPGERLVELGQDLDAQAPRPVVWGATTRIVLDYPLLGTGLGTFENAFPMYRPPSIRAHFDHAHSDWLQAAAEGGFLVPSALAAMLFLVLRATRRRFPVPSPAMAIGACASAGILAIAFHSLVDFDLRIPANAALLACLVGMALASSEVVPGD